MKKAAILLGILNAIDGLSTIAAIGTGHCVEGNLLMAFLLAKSTFLFLFAKLGLGTLFVYCLYLLRGSKLARIAIFSSLLIYVALMGIHLAFWISLL